MVRMQKTALTERLHDQCAYETGLAARLRAASRQDRLSLYGILEDDYTRHFPEHHPEDSSAAERIAGYEIAFLRRFLKPDTVLAEIGPGRGRLAFALAPHAARVYGVDVSEIYLPSEGRPSNFEFRLSDGIHMPFPPNTLDVVISNQLMEHLHPDDAADQLREIQRVLKQGGAYVCVTPSPINGPHDSSAYFDDLVCPIKNRNYVATGLHLKEYTSRELTALFRSVDFRRVQSWIGARGHYIPLPGTLLSWIESIVQLIPAPMRRRSSLLAPVLGNRVVATKKVMVIG